MSANLLGDREGPRPHADSRWPGCPGKGILGRIGGKTPISLLIVGSEDAGRDENHVYPLHDLFVVTGIIVAAGADETAIAHPSDEATVATTALILGGPALYLVGNALFKWALWHHVPRSRPVSILGLAALIPLASISSALVLLAAATVVLVLVALWDIRDERLRTSAA